ncbi:MAG: hypothetical protein IIZ15_03800, partial [Coriobacteriales bacterium]|nr:hypothetical protein [Coriobacteriales bacterium]
MSSLFIALLLVTGFSPSWAGSMTESEIEGAGGANGTGKQPLYHTGGAGDRPLSGTGVGPLPQRDDPDDGTQGVRQLEYGDGNIAASVDFGQDVRLPAGAQLRVTPMGEGSDLDAAWAAVAVQLSDMLGLHDEGIASAYAFYDVSIVSEDGAYLTIDVPATVVLEPRVPLFADVDGSETVAMVHVGDGGTAELLEKDVAFSQDGRVGSVAVTTDTGLSSFGFVLVRDTGAPSSDEGRQAGTQEQESPAPAADGGPASPVDDEHARPVSEGATSPVEDGPASAGDGDVAASDDDGAVMADDGSTARDEGIVGGSRDGAGVRDAVRSLFRARGVPGTRAGGADVSSTFNPTITSNKDTYTAGDTAIFGIAYDLEGNSYQAGDYVVL